MNEQERDYAEYLKRKGLSTNRSGYTYTKIASAPKIDFFLLHYIGGPFNATQEYLDSKKWFPKAPPRDQGTWEKFTTSQSSKDECSFRYCYKLTFIPMNQTPFAENTQIIIAVYQE